MKWNKFRLTTTTEAEDIVEQHVDGSWNPGGGD